MILRPYQQQALDALWDYLRARDGNPAIVLPTGAGKSPLAAAIARQAVEVWNGRVGVLAHVKELVEQNAAKMRMVWPNAPIGINSAGLGQRDRFAPILFMSIQSVHASAAVLGKFDLLLVDEAHRIPVRSEGMYRRFIADAKSINPQLRVVGLTATPYRLGVGPVCGPGALLTDCCYEVNVAELIDDGYLSPLVSRGGKARADLTGVHLRAGEYVERELAAAVDTDALVQAACDEMIELAANRRAWIVFCVNVKHAEHVAAVLAGRGIAAGVVHGDTPARERDATLARFQSGHLRALCNVNVLSEGFDAPQIDCVVMLRPTKSPGLYYQQVGRGFRILPAPGMPLDTATDRRAAIAAGPKPDCLVLDFAGNILEHGPVDAIRVSKPRVGAAKVVTGQAKECPSCAALVPVQTRRCECGHEWPAGQPSHLQTATGAAVLSAAAAPAEPVLMPVTAVEYRRHQKGDRTPSMRVVYQCGLRRLSEWICVEHAGMARQRAVAWWLQRAPGTREVPRTVEAAMAQVQALPRPVAVRVVETGKYPEIVSYVFRDDAECAGEADSRDARHAGAAGGDTAADAVLDVRGVPGWLLPALAASRAA